MSLKVTHPRKLPQSSRGSSIFTYNVSSSLQSSVSSRSSDNSSRNLTISFPVRPNKPTPTYHFQSIATDSRKAGRPVTRRRNLHEESSIEQRLDIIWRFFLAFVLELMGVWFMFIMAPYRFSVTTFRTVGKLIAVGPVLSV
ncbi:6193_t:CDS:2 [Paraglomus occultum]|uniref:6193_t:CDS:1 n=1 Tax=Paraglomus occultum TaxID=144539 RepID=A0A9N8W1H7_9GLOM|nr:6193_t:CDS:2 [Paraglomus occultum]